MIELNHYDIVIAGAGLVGASMACAIAEDFNTRHLTIAIVDPGQSPKVFSGNEFDPRVIALTRNSQRFLQRLSVWDSIEKNRVTPYEKMFVWDGEGTANIEFNSHEFKQENLGYIAENSLVLAELLRRLQDFPNVTIFRSNQVDGVSSDKVSEKSLSTKEKSNIEILLKDEKNKQKKITAALLVAADGAQSGVRKKLSMETREWDYGHDAIVTTVRTEKSHSNTAWQRFISTGPLAFLPLTTVDGDDHYCSIVWSLSKEITPEMMSKTDEEFSEALSVAFENKLGRIESVAKRFSFPLRQRHAVNYIQPGVALIGDAAHTIHPLAGQGVNLGLLDVQVLAGEIARAEKRGIPLNDFSVLKRYQRQRKPDNLTMMAAMEGFKRLFGSTKPALHILRNEGMGRLNSIPLLKNLIAKKAMGL
ncbi:MAG: UbiH/UbiF/VisC/COQ6 family ubiquinone biosynthesis hydroxylase [Cellvibrionaceae bacterium]